MMLNLDDIYDELTRAVHDDDEQAIRRIIESCRTSSNPFLQQLLHVAISKDDIAIVQCLLRYKIDVKCEDSDGRRALHVAAEFGNLQILKLIIYSGSPINIVNGQGIGALHMCLENNHGEAAVMLMKEGATVNRPRRYDTGEAPIHVAAKLGMNTVLGPMILKGGDVNLPCGNRSTPLHFAIREKHPTAVKLLCEAGANVHAVNSQGHTPFHLASSQVSVEMVRILLPYVRDLNFAGRNESTAVHYVASAHPPSYSQSEVLRMLIDHGADVRRRDRDGRTALHMVAFADNLPLAEVLVENGAELDVMDDVIGETPLNTASAHDRHDMIRFLLERGANVNLSDKHDQTPLHKLQTVRANRSKYQSTELLLKFGAKVNERNSRGATPFEQCIFSSIMNHECRESIGILRRLVSAGAQLQPCSGPRSLRNSPLCWLTWYNELQAAAFLVNAGWKLSEEKWLDLPGKNPAMEQFLSRLREIVHQPSRLSCICRRVVRERVSKVNDDRDVVAFVEQLPIPGCIKRFLTFEAEDDIL